MRGNKQGRLTYPGSNVVAPKRSAVRRGRRFQGFERKRKFSNLPSRGIKRCICFVQISLICSKLKVSDIIKWSKSFARAHHLEQVSGPQHFFRGGACPLLYSALPRNLLQKQQVHKNHYRKLSSLCRFRVEQSHFVKCKPSERAYLDVYKQFQEMLKLLKGW